MHRLGVCLAAATAAAAIHVGPALGDRREGPAQLQLYEGKRTACYTAAVAQLKEGCDVGDNGKPLMAETERRGLALQFANCQFSEDGLPTYAAVEEMAALAKGGDSMAYGVYTHHLAHVDVICMSLSQRLFQKHSRLAAQALAMVAQDSMEELKRAQDAIFDVQTKAEGVRVSLDEHRHEVVDGFDQLGERQAELERSVVSAQTQMEALSMLSEGISRDLLKVEASAQQLHSSQSAIAMVMDNVEFVVTQLLGSVDALKSVLSVAAMIVAILLATAPACTRAARAGMFTLCAGSFVAERYISTMLPVWYLEALPYPVTQHTVLAWSRSAFLVAALGHLTRVYLCFRDPHERLHDDVQALRSMVSTLLRRLPSASPAPAHDRGGSIASGHGHFTLPQGSSGTLSASAARSDRRGGSVEPAHPPAQSSSPPQTAPYVPLAAPVPLPKPLQLAKPAATAEPPAPARKVEEAAPLVTSPAAQRKLPTQEDNQSDTKPPAAAKPAQKAGPVLRYSSSWAPPGGIYGMFNGGMGGWGGALGGWANGWAAPAPPQVPAASVTPQQQPAARRRAVAPRDSAREMSTSSETSTSTSSMCSSSSAETLSVSVSRASELIRALRGGSRSSSSGTSRSRSCSYDSHSP